MGENHANRTTIKRGKKSELKSMLVKIQNHLILNLYIFAQIIETEYMNIKDILTISGQPGLFKLISQGQNAVIVENLETGKRMPSHANNRISALKDISVFTDTEELPLKDLFTKIFEKENGEQTENPKKMSGDALKAYFAELVPDYDRDRVYVSDMKKAIQWYNQLISKGMLTLEEEEVEEVEEVKEVKEIESKEETSEEAKKD